MRLVNFLLLALASTPALSADFYKWQDETGRIRYTDQPPPPTAKKVQKLKAGGTRLATEKTASAAQPFESKQAADKYPVVLFSFDECGDPCKNAVSFLDKRGIPYTLKNKDADKIELKQLTGGLTAPMMLVGKEMLKGFEAAAWSKLLDAAGYAKQNPYATPGKPKTVATSAGETTAVPASGASPGK